MAHHTKEPGYVPEGILLHINIVCQYQSVASAAMPESDMTPMVTQPMNEINA